MRVALVVGSVLLCINHGAVLIQGKMTRDRWIAAALTYIVPYCVSTHGQWSSQQRRD
ncbi:nitrate/nitrite transporter NrtS [Prochlorothrix hollandica]|uniref:nitrate/nitrite transporter NrtS n=1 Tax=Prochlorothrix hollandica TaxID=1223 RepID=UPI003341B954